MTALILFIPFALWIICFRHFFSGHLALEADAISYANHIGFYIDNLARGVYPLWDPSWYGGAPNDFFLRRIGDVNPLLVLLVGLKWLGVSNATSYLMFLAAYYFLGAWGFYLIARRLLGEGFYAFIAYTLFIFSSWGCEVFYNYIIIIFVPIAWFFYFLIEFAHHPKKGTFVGICFCLGLIVTTYIPFFFLTILGIFVFLYLIFYHKELSAFLQSTLAFIQKHALLALLCAVFLLSSCIPALLFYKESKSGEFVLPNRHSGADAASALAVSLDNVMSGDIISHGYFDRIFDDHAHLDLGDIYIPYLFFLILVTTIAARVDRLIFFLLFNILALSLITITSAAGVHHFLFQHILFFKFIRNIYYFFWLAMLPMGILLAVASLRSLLTAIEISSKKKQWAIYLLACHLIFVLFLLGHKGILWGAWASVFFSAVYFMFFCLAGKKLGFWMGSVLILLAIVIQSVQVYGLQAREIYKIQHVRDEFPKGDIPDPKVKMSLYYVAHWFALLVDYLDPEVLGDYVKHEFILYDNVVPYTDNPGLIKAFQTVIASNTNVAFLSKAESKAEDWKSNTTSDHQADLDGVSSGELSLVSRDANTLLLRTHLFARRFLVINDNYNTHWHAFINGQETGLFRANIAFKGLWVPAGDSRLLLRFETPGRYFVHITLITVFVAVFVWMLFLLGRCV